MQSSIRVRTLHRTASITASHIDQFFLFFSPAAVPHRAQQNLPVPPPTRIVLSSDFLCFLHTINMVPIVLARYWFPRTFNHGQVVGCVEDMRKSDSLTKRTVKNMIFYSAAVREMKEEIIHSSRTATTKIEDRNWDEESQELLILYCELR